jgi:hypothetical protein
VLDAVQRLEKRWEAELHEVEFAVEDVPSAEPAAPGGPRTGSGQELIPLARLFPRHAGHPARIVLYRRPIETRAVDLRELGALVHDVVVEQVADLLGMDPGAVDPTYEDPEL